MVGIFQAVQSSTKWQGTKLRHLLSCQLAGATPAASQKWRSLQRSLLFFNSTCILICKLGSSSAVESGFRAATWQQTSNPLLALAMPRSSSSVLLENGFQAVPVSKCASASASGLCLPPLAVQAELPPPCRFPSILQAAAAVWTFYVSDAAAPACSMHTTLRSFVANLGLRKWCRRCCPNCLQAAFLCLGQHCMLTVHTHANAGAIPLLKGPPR